MAGSESAGPGGAGKLVYFIIFFFPLKKRKVFVVVIHLGKGIPAVVGPGGERDLVESGGQGRGEGSLLSECVGARGMHCAGKQQEKKSVLMRQNARGRALFPTYLLKLHPYPHACFWRTSLLTMQLITVFP